MPMSRKDFVMLADAIKGLRHNNELRHHTPNDEKVVDLFACHVAGVLTGHVASFDKMRFLKACGVGDAS